MFSGIGVTVDCINDTHFGHLTIFDLSCSMKKDTDTGNQ